jgi:hypothetical protein
MNKKFITEQKVAIQELKKNKRRFKTKRQTTLVRIQRKWIGPLKVRAQEKKRTLSKLHDEIYPFYFKHNADDG